MDTHPPRHISRSQSVQDLPDTVRIALHTLDTLLGEHFEVNFIHFVCSICTAVFSLLSSHEFGGISLHHQWTPTSYTMLDIFLN